MKRVFCCCFSKVEYCSLLPCGTSAGWFHSVFEVVLNTEGRPFGPYWFTWYDLRGWLGNKINYLATSPDRMQISSVKCPETEADVQSTTEFVTVSERSLLLPLPYRKHAHTLKTFKAQDSSESYYCDVTQNFQYSFQTFVLFQKTLHRMLVHTNIQWHYWQAYGWAWFLPFTRKTSEREKEQHLSSSE